MTTHGSHVGITARRSGYCHTSDRTRSSPDRPELCCRDYSERTHGTAGPRLNSASELVQRLVIRRGDRQLTARCGSYEAARGPWHHNVTRGRSHGPPSSRYSLTDINVDGSWQVGAQFVVANGETDSHKGCHVELELCEVAVVEDGFAGGVESGAAEEAAAGD